MVSEHDMDTTWATTVTQFFKEQLSTYSAAPNSILGSISTIPVTYGMATTSRKIQDPETIVHAGREWDGRRAKKVTLVQTLDLINESDGVEITRAEFAADPEGARIQINNTSMIFRNAIEKTLVAGNLLPTCRGIADFPDGTAGTINRPEVAYNCAVGTDWSTVSAIRNDIILSIQGLILKRFYGPFLILAPEIVAPMLTEVIANTAVPTNQWVKSSAGLNVAYSPFVHEAATKDSFNVYIIDTSKVHLGLSDMMFDAYYEQKDHAYYWDWECYMTVLFDPLYDGTEYLKGVAHLSTRDWSD